MKKLISPKSEKVILNTHPIVSDIKGWFLKIVETSNNAFYVEAADNYGRIVSKQGNDPSKLRYEVEVVIKEMQKN